MPFHIGINPYFGDISLYNEADKSIEYIIDVPIFDSENYIIFFLVSMEFEKIKTKIDGSFGCACICLHPEYGNEIRKKFIEEILKIGFKKIEVINWETASYLNAMSQINYKPLNGDIIWIQEGNNFYVWKINGQTNAVFLGQRYANVTNLNAIENIIKKFHSNKGPDVVLHHQHKIEEANILKTSPACKFFEYIYNDNSYSSGSLVKARIASGEREVAYLKVVNFLHQKITLKIGETEITNFKEYQKLPIMYSQTLIRKSNVDKLFINGSFMGGESLTLPDSDKIQFTFKIENSGIYYVNFVEQHIENITPSKSHNFFNKFKGTLKFALSNTSATSIQKLASYSIPKFTVSKNINMDATGIDLGTSRCCAAVIRRNGIETVHLDHIGARLLPSYVSYEEKNPIFGQVVVNRLRQFSRSTVFDSKRIIGRSINEIEIDSNWPFQITENDGKVIIEVKKGDITVQKSAEEVATDLLKFIKHQSEEFQGTKLRNVIITVPATFTEAQNGATLNAAKLAGWETVKLLPEPVAAAFAYSINQSIPNYCTALLFDLGGGTLDVCIFKIENNQIQIISNTGDSKLGGRDFDTVLFNYFKNHLFTKHAITMNRDKKFKLILECQKLKEDLSTVPICNLNIDDYNADIDGIISIKRADFETMTKPLTNRIRNTINSALLVSKQNSEEINKILLVGGGSRMPMIKNLLHEIFPKAEQCIHQNPDEVVAIGAAYYAYSIFSHK